MARILCGPIVGLVKEESAIVLFEIDIDATVTFILQENTPKETNISVTKVLQGRRPFPIVFEGLKPDTTYKIAVGDGFHADHQGAPSLGRVKTLPIEAKRMHVAAVSCDLATFKNKSGVDMWEKLYQEGMKSNVHVILHMGDNIYIDETSTRGLRNREIIENDDVLLDPAKTDQNVAYIKARKALHDLPRSEWQSHRNDLLEVYRQKYRDFFWGRPSKAQVLANFSNLMILDDHEIRENYGMEPEDADPDSKEFFIAGIALQVYHEYQRQLWDPDTFAKSDTLTSEFYSITFGRLGIIMLDSRLPQSYYRNRQTAGDNSYFGKDQYDKLLRLLTPSDDKQEVMWILVASLPLMFMKKKINDLIVAISSDDIGAFINNHHEKELVPILESIQKWKGSGFDYVNKLPREILILAGDIHIGGFTDIEHKDSDQILCRQITTSAITNCNIGLAKYATLRSLMHFTESYGSYNYVHYDWTNRCNFCILSTDFNRRERIYYSVQLITETEAELRESTDLNWDKGPTRCPRCALL